MQNRIFAIFVFVSWLFNCDCSLEGFPGFEFRGVELRDHYALARLSWVYALAGFPVAYAKLSEAADVNFVVLPEFVVDEADQGVDHAFAFAVGYAQLCGELFGQLKFVHLVGVG